MTLGPDPLQAAFQDAFRRQQAGDLPGAIAGYENILQQDPAHSRAWHLLGVAFLQCGEADRAVAAIRRAIALDGGKAAFHNNLGVALLGQDMAPDAKEAFAAAVALDPQYADAVANLGLVHARLGHVEDAGRFYRQALRLQPRHVDALFNLGNLFLDAGKADEAIGLYQEALRSQNGRSDILNNLGRAFLAKSQAAEAVACFEKALAVDPRCGKAAFNLGKAYGQEEKTREAERAFETAARLRPDKAIWGLHRLGLCPTIFQSAREIDDYRAELERRLDDALNYSPLPSGGEGPGVRGLLRRLDVAELATDAFVPSFNLAHHGRSNRRLFEKFAALFSPHIPRRKPTGSGGKRRVGFVVTAPHVGSFLRTQGGVVEQLDPKRFDVVVCCNASAIAGLRQGIRRDNVRWVPFGPRFNDAADTIAAAACDVLYFHKVSTDPLGYLLPFARLAPVQCTAWTTHFTSGVPEVDYYLSSALVESPQADYEYTEKLVRLDAFPSYERRPGTIAPATRADFGLPGQGSLYLCPQRLAKFHPDQDDLFHRILDEDSTGRLVLLAGNNASALDQLMIRLRRTLGAAADRIVVVPPLSPARLRQLMLVCDALLDITHYSASLMAKDAFAANLPIVTLPGTFKVERYTLGFYRKLGIGDPIAGSPEEYVRLAVGLGKDSNFRRGIQDRIQSVSHLLFEDRRTVSEFERFAEEATPILGEG